MRGCAALPKNQLPSTVPTEQSHGDALVNLRGGHGGFALPYFFAFSSFQSRPAELRKECVKHGISAMGDPEASCLNHTSAQKQIATTISFLVVSNEELIAQLVLKILGLKMLLPVFRAEVGLSVQAQELGRAPRGLGGT